MIHNNSQRNQKSTDNQQNNLFWLDILNDYYPPPKLNSNIVSEEYSILNELLN